MGEFAGMGNLKGLLFDRTCDGVRPNSLAKV